MRGVTLIEVLVVIAIIGVMSAIILPNLHTVRDRGFLSTTLMQMREIAKAAQIYQIDKGSYPIGSGLIKDRRPLSTLPAEFSKYIAVPTPQCHYWGYGIVLINQSTLVTLRKIIPLQGGFQNVDIAYYCLDGGVNCIDVPNFALYDITKMTSLVCQ